MIFNSKIADRVLACVLVLILGAYAAWMTVRGAETWRRQRLRASAVEQARLETTNAIVGLRTIVSLSLQELGPHPQQWTAQVQAEFINKAGALKRTNLFFAFKDTTGYKGGRELEIVRITEQDVEQRKNRALGL